MPGPAYTKLPTLPEDVATLVVRQLSCGDLYSLMSTCKAFWAWGSTTEFVEVFEKAPAARRPSQSCLGSLRLFLHRRGRVSSGLKVKALHLYFNKGEDLAESKDLSMSLQICSATITELYLAPLDITAGFDEYTMLKKTICQCKHLSTLHIAFKVGKRFGPPPDASSLLMELSSALPNLATLHWRESELFSLQRRPTRHIFSAFTANPYRRPGLARIVASETLAGSGLRLLQTEACSFSNAALPTTLQVLSLRNTGRACQPLRERLDLLLAPCTALRELYIQQLDISDAACLDLPLIAALCPALSVLVLHVQTQNCKEAAPLGTGEGVLPSLEVLMISVPDLDSDQLILRAPALQVLGMDLTGAPNLAEELLASAGPRLQHLQLVTSKSGPDMLWDGFWSAVRAFTDLTALQLVFLPDAESLLDEQVFSFLEAGLREVPLPMLRSVGLYMERGDAHEVHDPDPYFVLGPPGLPNGCAQSVCDALGRLVVAGVLPALAQVLLYPCMQLLEGETPKATEEEFVEWKELRSPRCAGAPGVRVTCRRKTEGYADVQYACALRGPQRGGALSSAAYRAFNSLDTGPDGSIAYEEYGPAGTQEEYSSA